jgi:hypothetical protein
VRGGVDAALRAVASDWRVAAIFRASSGEPLTVTVTGDPAGTGIGGQRANMVLGDPYGAKTLNNYLNAAAFSRPANGALGVQQRGSFTGPGSRNVDIAVVRVFRFGPNRVEARVESFNLMNWTRWNNPGTNFNALQTFGRITSSDDPRIMRFAIKYQF